MVKLTVRIAVQVGTDQSEHIPKMIALPLASLLLAGVSVGRHCDLHIWAVTGG